LTHYSTHPFTDVRELVSHLSARGNHSPPGSRFGMARMYEFRAKDRGHNVCVFPSVDDAENWLTTGMS
jgi:hypothetical protein